MFAQAHNDDLQVFAEGGLAVHRGPAHESRHAHRL